MTLYFEDYHIGQTFSVKPISLSAEEIIAFAEPYDPRPFHLSEEAAQNTRFKGLIASGFHTLTAAWSAWVKSDINKDGTICGIGIDHLRWTAPVYAGDTLQSQLTIIAKKPSASGDSGTITCLYETQNQHHEKVLSFEGLVLVACRPC